MNEKIKAILSGAEAHGELSAIEVSDVIANVADHGAEERIARQSLAGGGELTDSERADMDRLLGRQSTPQERNLLRRCIEALIE